MASAPAPTPEAPVASPCTGICRPDDAGETCVGCHRTLDEIGRWGTASEAERRAILNRIG